MKITFGSIGKSLSVKRENLLQFSFSENPASPDDKSDTYIHFRVDKVNQWRSLAFSKLVNGGNRLILIFLFSENDDGW